MIRLKDIILEEEGFDMLNLTDIIDDIVGRYSNGEIDADEALSEFKSRTGYALPDEDYETFYDELVGDEDEDEDEDEEDDEDDEED
ncbi:MAG: hypothetical protein QXD03_02270 [Candidatus Anstonellales archaeon]